MIRPAHPVVVLALFPLTLIHANGARAQQEESWAAAIAERFSSSVVVIVKESPTGSSTGSGFFVDSVGTLITNLHVVRGATTLQVRLANDEEYRVLGFYNLDVNRDLIVLRIPAVDVVPVNLGSLEEAKPGEPVVAIGNPLGEYVRSVTTGVVSGIREEEGTRWLQHSAPISPGNSGGPLFSRTGDVIGVNTKGYMEGAQNLNFASPIEYVRGLLEAKGNLRPMSELSEELAFAESTSSRTT